MLSVYVYLGFPGGSVVKNLPTSVGYSGSIPGSGRSPGAGSGNPPQDSCLENPMDRGAWRASPWGCKESDTTERAHMLVLYLQLFFLDKCWQIVQFIYLDFSLSTIHPGNCFPVVYRDFLKQFYFFNFGCVGSLLLCACFLLYQVRPALHCGVRASHCSGFSCCGAQALGRLE